MDRLTRRTPQGVECDDTSAALEKPGPLRRPVPYLEQRQDRLSQKLADLRASRQNQNHPVPGTHGRKAGQRPHHRPAPREPASVIFPPPFTGGGFFCPFFRFNVPLLAP